MIDESNRIDKVFDKHIEYEFENKDLEATMSTMIKDPYVHHVPTLTGGIGYSEVRSFYKNHFIGKMPKDIKIKPISRTVGQDQVVDEVIISFTHDSEIDYMLPGVAPTGKYVEIPHVVIMKFIKGKIAHEHIYWDQASVLVQLGLVDQKNLPITGIQQSQRIKELVGRDLYQ